MAIKKAKSASFAVLLKEHDSVLQMGTDFYNRRQKLSEALAGFVKTNPNLSLGSDFRHAGNVYRIEYRHSSGLYELVSFPSIPEVE